MMAIVGLLFIIGAVLLVSGLLGKNIFGKNQTLSNPFQQNRSAREILAERYARGEITREQFEQMKNDIG
jgi:uncharacterized membrane protein